MARPGCDVLVTGAAGMLGSAVLAVCASRGTTALGVTRGVRLAVPGARWLQLDLLDAAATLAALDAQRPRAIVHCAAHTDVDGCERDPALARRINVDITEVLARWARANGARLVYVSTDSVFDGRRGGYSEADAPAPVNVYGATKLAGEAAAQHAPRHLVLRTNLYGWCPPPKQRLCEWALERLQQGETVPGFTDVRFSPLAVPFLAVCIARAVEGPATGVAHLVAADGASKFEFLQMFAAGMGFSENAVVATRAAEARFFAPRPLDTTLVSLRSQELQLGTMPTVAGGLAQFTAGTRPAPPRIIDSREGTA